MFESGFTELKFQYAQYAGAAGHRLAKEIRAGGYTWYAVCYPRGFKDFGDEEHASLYVVMKANKSKALDIDGICEAFVMGKDGAPSSPCVHRSVMAWHGSGFGFGWPRFMKRSDLEPLYAVDGVVTLVCGVIVLRDNSVAVPPSDIGEHLGRLLEGCADGSSDVSFSVGGETFRAHRAVLAARSPVFRAELFGSMAEAAMPCIVLHDLEPETFKLMLRFMYTDALPNDCRELTAELLQDLLAAADRYALDRLKLMCAKKLCDILSIDTVATMLACAETHSCPELKSSCLEFFMAEENFRKTVVTEGYLQLMHSFPSLIDEIRARVNA